MIKSKSFTLSFCHSFLRGKYKNYDKVIKIAKSFLLIFIGHLYHFVIVFIAKNTKTMTK